MRGLGSVLSTAKEEGEVEGCLLMHPLVPHGKPDHENTLRSYLFWWLFCCKILSIINICNPWLNSYYHRNSHLIGTISLGEYIFKMLLYLQDNIFDNKRLQFILPSSVSSRTQSKYLLQKIGMLWLSLHFTRGPDTVSGIFSTKNRGPGLHPVGNTCCCSSSPCDLQSPILSPLQPYNSVC